MNYEPRMTSITFILGGARCGKSLYAEHLAEELCRRKIYLATAENTDAEMDERIKAHRTRRTKEWETIEEPLYIAKILENPSYKDSVILVDCLTLWLSNLMHRQLDIAEQTEMLINALHAGSADVIFVSNEVGQGIIPQNTVARTFRDYAGLLHQRIAAKAGRVIWMVAGLPVSIKG